MIVEFGKNYDLNSVTQLDISEIEALATLPAELFQSLRHLRIRVCHNFQGLDQAIRPCVETLCIEYCPAMSSMDLQSFVRLRELEISGCRGLQSLQGLQFLTALEKMHLGSFSDKMHYFPLPIEPSNPFSSLRELAIFGWPTLKSLPDQLQRLTTLKSLVIAGFDGLEVLPEWLGNLTLLQGLGISRCKDLSCLPSKEQMQRLASLKRLSIHGSPKLERRCDRGGPEWPKISHIPHLSIYD